MFETSYIELDREALRANRAFLEQHCGKDRIISSVVKGNAYGHGIEQFVPLAESCGWGHFSVFSADEAVRAQAAKKKSSSLMVMGSMEDGALAWSIENGVDFYVFNFERLQKAAKIAKAIGRPALVHLEMETGMNRTGFEEQDQKRIAEFVRKHKKYCSVKGICTHYAGAESYGNFERVREQMARFEGHVHEMKARGVHPENEHSCCSAAAIRFPEKMAGLVRIGIMQYGFWPSEETWSEYARAHELQENPLRRLLSWKSRLMDVKQVKSGEYIGYGTSYLAQKDTTIGVAAVGYAHGFSRTLSNQGRALVRGVRVPVVGMVNMNCLALDLTDTPACEIGDEVVLIGHQGEHQITVASFSEYSTQLNYELLTRLPASIPRKIN